MNAASLRTLAVDLGQRRVGLAMSDEGGRFATPLDVLEVHGTEQAIGPVVGLIQKEEVRRLVVGLPLNMDNSVGAAAREAVVWGRQVASLARVEVIFVDERLSSFEAEQRLNARKRGGEKMTRKGKKGQLDAQAAAGFLQEFLDGRLGAIEVGG